MYEATQNSGFLSGDAFPDEVRNRDPLETVMAVAGPREDIAAGGGLPEEDSATPGAPHDAQPAREREDYGEFDWPDGYVADPRAMAKFVPLARKLALPKEGAQELANLYADLDRERNTAQAEFIARNNTEWLREIRNHPEFGGRNLERTGSEVAGMMRRYGSPQLMAQIRQMNIQNWPEMFYFLARVSQVMSEDCSPSRIGAAAPAKSTAQLLFPGLN